MEHEHGWRAECAYPSRLRLVCGICLRDGRGAGRPDLAWREGDGIETRCSAHAGLLGRTEKSYDPRDVEAELLSTYAVDLLPERALAEVFWADPPVVAPAGVVARRPSIVVRTGLASDWPRIARSLLVLALIVWWLWAPLQRVFESGEPVTAAAEISDASGPLSRSVPFPPWVELGATPRRERVHRPRKSLDREPPWKLALVCGIPHGTWIEYAGCLRARATLLGWAESPPARNDSSCRAFTRRARYSVCWIWFDADVDLIRRPAAPNPSRGAIARVSPRRAARIT
jgi:hypothetical protein